MNTTGSWLTLAGAAALVVGVTLLQGIWTDRWQGKTVSRELEQAATLMESVFPKSFGDWELERDFESDPKELERAGAVGHISRLYRNTRTKARVSAFVVCAKPHDASGHTPDRCYPGAGFEIGEAEHRRMVTLANGRNAETFIGTFRKSGQTLRIFWTYGTRDAASVKAEQVAAARSWIAPQIARLALANEPAVYKLYAIVDETRISSAQATVECEDFLSNLLPALDEALVAGGAGGGEAAAGSTAAHDATAGGG